MSPGLLTSRAPVRAREIALRLAVGASRFRMVRQLITESLLIAIGGGALGLALSYGVIAMFQQLEFPTDFPLKLTFALDARVLLVGIAVAAASAALSSLLPAWQASRADLVSTLKNPTAAASRRSRLWGRSVLVSGQVALTLVLLTVSVFLYRAFQAELTEGPGFRTSGLVMMAFDPGLARYDEARTREFYRLLTEKARAIPGVTSVTLTSSVPMKADTLEFTPIAPEGFTFAAGVENVNTASARIDEGYFDTLEIPIVRGRGIRVYRFGERAAGGRGERSLCRALLARPETPSASASGSTTVTAHSRRSSASPPTPSTSSSPRPRPTSSSDRACRIPGPRARCSSPPTATRRRWWIPCATPFAPSTRTCRSSA